MSELIDAGFCIVRCFGRVHVPNPADLNGLSLLKILCGTPGML
jgi:hypothetical protein